MTAPTQAQIEAAAQVLSLYSDWPPHENRDRWLSLAKAALTAAGEVGEQRQEGMAWIAHEIKLRTIERCAQVAEQPKDIYGIGTEIAAAIRALKDQP